MKVLIFVLALLTSFVPLAASAQVATEVISASAPLWSDFLDPILTVAFSAVASVLTAVLVKVLKGVGINLDRQTQEVIDQALERSIGFGYKKVSETTGFATSQVEFENGAIQNSVLYLKKHWPDTVKKYGWTDEEIADMVKSRLGLIEISPEKEAE